MQRCQEVADVAVVLLELTNCSYRPVKGSPRTSVYSYSQQKGYKLVSAPAYSSTSIQSSTYNNANLLFTAIGYQQDAGTWLQILQLVSKVKKLPRRQRCLREELLKECAFGYPPVNSCTWNNQNNLFKLGWAWISGWGRMRLLPCASCFCE